MTESTTATTGRRAPPPRMAAVLVALALPLFVVLSRLDDVLRGMHPQGSSAYGMGDLVTMLPPWKPERALDAVAAWTTDRPSGFTSAGTVVTWYLLVDVVFAVVLALLLWALLARAVAALERGTTPPRPAFVLLALVLYLAFDLTENGLSFVTLHGLGLWGGGRASVVDPNLAEFLTAASWCKSLAFVLALLGLLVHLVAVMRSPGSDGSPSRPNARSRARLAWRRLVILRGQCALAGIFAAAVMLLPVAAQQSADVLRGWPDDLGHAAVGTAWIVLFSLALFGGGWALLGRAASPRGPADHWVDPGVFGFNRLEGVGLAISAGSIGVGLYGDNATHDGRGLIVLGVMVATVTLIGRFLPSIGRPALGMREPPRDAAAVAVAAAIAATPLIALGLALMSAGVSQIAYSETGRPALSLWLSIVWALALQAVGWWLYLGRNWLMARLTGSEGTNAPLLCAAVLAAATALTIALSPNGLGYQLGAVGVLGAFMFVAAVLAYGLGVAVDWLPPGRAFAAFGMTRAPLIVLLGLWLLVASASDDDGRRYNVRLLSAKVAEASTVAAFGRPAPHEPLSRPPEAGTDPVARAFTTWLQNAKRESGPTKVLPMVFIAASGGGARAGYWTALTMDCIVNGREGVDVCPVRTPWDRRRVASAIFLASGASGGSFGLATYTADLIRSERLDSQPGSRRDPDWVDRTAGDDFLGPILAAGLFRDLPLAFIRSDDIANRADALEVAWESSWGATANPLHVGFLELEKWRKVAPIPYLVLNGTTVQDGCRFNTSALNVSVEQRQFLRNGGRRVDECLGVRDLEAHPRSTGANGPAEARGWALSSTEDLVDVLCPKEDIRLSTAALLSARFPFVSPSGRLQPGCRTGTPQVNVVDGGIFDNSGAGAIAELWRAVEDDVAAQNARAATRARRAQDGRASSEPAEPFVKPVFLQIDNHFADPQPSLGGRTGEIATPLRAVSASVGSREARARQEAALEFRVGGRAVSVYPRASPNDEPPLGWSLSKASRDQLRRQLSENCQELSVVRGWLEDTPLACPE